MIRSPLFIRVALHYWYSPEPWPEPSPAADEVHTDLQRAGLLRWEVNRYEGVKVPLQMYVEALGSVPLPVKKWVMPEQEEG